MGRQNQSVETNEPDRNSGSAARPTAKIFIPLSEQPYSYVYLSTDTHTKGSEGLRRNFISCFLILHSGF